MEKKYKVYICEYIHPEAMEYIKSYAEVIDDEAELSECDAALNRTYMMDKAWFDKCPNLKVASIHGVGIDGIDLEEAKRRGIKAFNTPGANAESVAELVVAFALSMARQLPAIDRAVVGGEKLKNGCSMFPGHEIMGKTLGVIGCGDIAMRAARKLRDGLGMKVIGWSRSLTPAKAEELGIGYCSSIEEVFENSDIVNIGLALNNETRNLIALDTLKHVKKNCILINTARGGIVNEKDLYTALTEGIIQSAAIDAFEKEPVDSSNPLIGLPNCLGIPHIGASTEEALLKTGMLCAKGIEKLLSGVEDGVHLL